MNPFEDFQKQAMKDTLNNTKGKHGRKTFMQEELSIDDILIADDKQTLKEAILTARRHGTRIRNRLYQGCAHPFSSSWSAHFLFSISPGHQCLLWQRVQVWPCPKGWYRHLSWWKEIHDIQELKVATWKKNSVVSDKCIHGLPVTIVSKNIKCLLVIKTIWNKTRNVATSVIMISL